MWNWLLQRKFPSVCSSANSSVCVCVVCVCLESCLYLWNLLLWSWLLRAFCWKEIRKLYFPWTQNSQSLKQKISSFFPLRKYLSLNSLLHVVLFPPTFLPHEMIFKEAGKDSTLWWSAPVLCTDSVKYCLRIYKAHMFPNIALPFICKTSSLLCLEFPQDSYSAESRMLKWNKALAEVNTSISYIKDNCLAVGIEGGIKKVHLSCRAHQFTFQYVRTAG